MKVMIRNGQVLSGVSNEATEINYTDLEGKESSLKEQLDKINTAIGSGGIDSIKEHNKNQPLKFWVGTCDEYAPFDDHPDPNMLYIKTDEKIKMSDNILYVKDFIEGTTPIKTESPYTVYRVDVTKAGYVPISAGLLCSQHSSIVCLGSGLLHDSPTKWEMFTTVINIGDVPIVHSMEKKTALMYYVTYIKDDFYN